jgi:hypothetical protein
MFGGGETSTGAPKIVYPLDGSMHPHNITDVTVQWQGTGAGQPIVYRLRFSNGAETLSIYTACSTVECVFVVPPALWRGMAAANRDADVTITVSAAGDGTRVPTSAPIKIRFSPDPVLGGLYYWSTEQKTIFRLTFGDRKAKPFYTSSVCPGCHTVSRDGSRIVWLDTRFGPASVGQGEQMIQSSPTDSRPLNPPGLRAPNTFHPTAINRDGSRFIATDGRVLYLHDSVTYKQISEGAPTGRPADRFIQFMEWSPDEQTLVVTVGQQAIPGLILGGVSEIALVPFNGGKFGALKTLVPAASGQLNYYPSWSPDGKWIVFVSAPSGPGLTSYDNKNGRLRLIATNGGTIYDLGRASQAIGNHTSWPKFSPFSQLGGKLLFVSFSSKADYGFLLPNSKQPDSDVEAWKSQLWFAAIDLRRLPEGDPSWAPIWLPFQSVDQSNHLPYWTEVVPEIVQ